MSPRADTERTQAPLQGRTALVTGSSRNLGAEIALCLAADGARVVITYHESPDEARLLLERLAGGKQRGHISIGCDLASPSGVREMVDAVDSKLEVPVDILVNNLGQWAGNSLLGLSDDEWDLVVETNLRAALLTSQLIGPRMKSAGWGRIINISAGSAYVRNHAIYGLAKAAVSFLTEELALELAPEVTVNAVAPGQIMESADEAEVAMPGFIESTLRQTPAGRLVTRQEVAQVVSALCSKPFSLVTGVTIPIDGGWRLCRR